MRPEYRLGGGVDSEAGREGPGMFYGEEKPGVQAARELPLSEPTYSTSKEDTLAGSNMNSVKTSEETVTLSEIANDQNDPEDGKTLFLQGKLDEAKEAWLRTLRSVSYIIEHYHDDAENPVETPAEQQASPDAKKSSLSDYLVIKKVTLSNLALVSVNLREFGDAVRFCEEVLALDPGNEKAIYRRSLSLFEQGKLREAQAKLQEYLASGPPAGVSAAIVYLAKQIDSSVGKKIRMDRAMITRSFLPPKKPTGFQRLAMFWSFGLGLMGGIFSTLRAHLGFLFNRILYMRYRRGAPKTE